MICYSQWCSCSAVNEFCSIFKVDCQRIIKTLWLLHFHIFAVVMWKKNLGFKDVIKSSWMQYISTWSNKYNTVIYSKGQRILWCLMSWKQEQQNAVRFSQDFHNSWMLHFTLMIWWMYTMIKWSVANVRFYQLLYSQDQVHK